MVLRTHRPGLSSTWPVRGPLGPTRPRPEALYEMGQVYRSPFCAYRDGLRLRPHAVFIRISADPSSRSGTRRLLEEVYREG